MSVDVTDRPFAAISGVHSAPFALRPYQVDGIYRLYLEKRFFLTDEPRLGKTVQAVFASEPPVLILTRAHLVQQWADFLYDCKIPHNRVAVAIGTREEKQDALDRSADYYVTNIESARLDPHRPEKALRFQTPRTLIVDEAHHVRGRTSQQSVGIHKLAWRPGCERVYLLTGTPVVNRPDDLFAQLRLLDKERFSSYWQFVNTYANVVDIGFGPRVYGISDKTKAEHFYAPLRRVFESFSLGRTAEQVGLQLSEVTEQVLRIPPSSEFKRVYKRLKTEYENDEGELLGSLMEVAHELRRMTATEKVKPLLEWLVDNKAMSGTVVFTQYRSTCELLARMLNCPFVHGGIEPNERAAIAANADFMVATSASLTEGVNLPHMPNAIVFEHDYVPGVMHQALSRNRLAADHRHVLHLLVKGTVDETIYNAVQSRTADIRQIMREAMKL